MGRRATPATAPRSCATRAASRASSPIWVRSASWMCCTPMSVSYTHLDVYKRQGVLAGRGRLSTGSKTGFHQTAGHGAAAMAGTVSCTHLDVYKRQTMSTRLPSAATQDDRLTAVVVLPTPPFWFAIATIFATHNSSFRENLIVPCGTFAVMPAGFPSIQAP